MATSQTIGSNTVIRNPQTRTQDEKYYCTDTEWREISTLTNQADFPTYKVLQKLEEATEQVKKDAFYMMRYELATKDSEGRYFTARKWWVNKYGRNNSDVKIFHNRITKYDLEIYEAQTISSIAATLAYTGTKVSKIYDTVPYEAITEIDPLNCFFKLDSTYPRENRQIYVNYWVVGKPFHELLYELKLACAEMATILLYKDMKTQRLKKGTTQITLGKQTVIRNEEAFDSLINHHKKEYLNKIRWFKSFIGRRVKIGRAETWDWRKGSLNNWY